MLDRIVIVVFIEELQGVSNNGIAGSKLNRKTSFSVKDSLQVSSMNKWTNDCDFKHRVITGRLG